MFGHFLEKKEKALASFIQYFKKIGPPDEKAKLVDKFLEIMYKSLENEPIWKAASVKQINTGRAVIERSVMSQVYVLALFPNGDGDMLRDQILSRSHAAAFRTSHFESSRSANPSNVPFRKPMAGSSARNPNNERLQNCS